MKRPLLSYLLLVLVACAPAASSAQHAGKLYVYRRAGHDELVVRSQPDDQAGELVEIIQPTGRAVARPTRRGAPRESFMRPLPNPRARPYLAMIEEEAAIAGLELALVLALIEVESNFNPGATSRVGAIGLMQLMPGLASDYDVEDVRDPRQNVRGGCAYLARLIRRYGGNTHLALAAYNTGPRRVERERGAPEATRDYVKKITRKKARWRAWLNAR